METVFAKNDRVFSNSTCAIEKVTEIVKEEDGRYVKKEYHRSMLFVTPDVEKAVKARRAWEKFGDVSGVGSGPEEGITRVGNDVRIGPGAKTEKKPVVSIKVVCSHCGGNHYSFKCTMKDAVGKAKPEGAAEKAPVAAIPAKTGRYVPPSARGNLSGEKDKTTIRIANLPRDTCEDDVRKFCSMCGNVKRVHLVMRRNVEDDGVERATFGGLSFVEFRDLESAKKAVEQLNKKAFGDQIMDVVFAD
ncbi:MAG: translation initiation factor eIF3G [Amphiamblys sp. WSBS2006]|nr:MAG: translation initiation factor eIF3G [Amphiamblys sp. WSBS2006]